MKKETFIQFIKFGIVGVSNTLVGYILNVGILFLLKGLNWKYDYLAANVMSFILGVLWSFFWNEKYVFTEKQDEYKNSRHVRLIKMYLSYSFTGIVLNNILSFVWISVLGISKLIAPLINSAIGVPINFLIIKKWTFEE